MMMGADFYQTEEGKASSLVNGDVPVSVGENTKIRKEKSQRRQGHHLEKRAKVEGNEAADCRNLGYKVEGEGGVDGTQEEVELKNKLERLRGLLKDDPCILRNKVVEDVIRYLDVVDIISSALRSSYAEKNLTGDDYGYLDVVKPIFAPSPEKVERLVELMLLCGIEELKAVDLFILYNNFPKAGFASMLLHALDSYSMRRLDGGELLRLKEMRVDIYKLCRVLPWKLFAHVMYKLTLLPVFEHSTCTTSTNEEEKEGEIQKEAAESCDICNGKGKHSGVYGYYCSYWHYVPCGVTVGPSHMLFCRDCCHLLSSNTFVGCSCGSQIGKAVPCSLSWRSK